MQLPRGTFRTLKRGISLDDLADELKNERFSGSCTITRDKSEIVMVFRNGSLILASYGDMEGNAAWERIQSTGTDPVDAALSSLTEAQLGLALEFNSNARIQRITPQERRAPVNPLKSVETKKPDMTSDKDIRHINTQRRREEKPPSLIHEKEVNGKNIPPKSHNIPQKKEVAITEKVAEETDTSIPKSPDEEQSSSCQGLEALDSMDIESMTQKIRNNCIVMIEKLHLEHLIETKKGQGGR
ncbi:MAG TPA: hypothetical protein PLV96_06775 [Methanoregulaceae archaeon]|nr:hypothetical protein [Methanoregulaceae archaeon]MDD5684209.1 hypothetical protein [Methanoregulaceae archaeon]HPX73551.1 hypothetical protein [Methanoregulaceae archaeon]HQA80485.1 hypothetical protein [Methanoregulaceae archaeon]